MIEEWEVAAVIARVASKLPGSIAAEGFEAQDEEQFQAYIERDAYDRVFGQSQPAPANPIEEVEEEWRPAGPGAGLEDIMPGLSG